MFFDVCNGSSKSVEDLHRDRLELESRDTIRSFPPSGKVEATCDYGDNSLTGVTSPVIFRVWSSVAGLRLDSMIVFPFHYLCNNHPFIQCQLS